jgi:deoxyribonuclease-4
MSGSNLMVFGTVGAPAFTPKNPGGSIGAIHQLSKLGLGALELGWVQSVRISEEKCKEIKQQAKNNQILISVHAPYYINLNADDQEWPKSRKRLMDAAYYGNLAGATDIVFHPGSYFNQDPKSVRKIAIIRLRDCIEELRSSANPVILRPETMGKQAMLGSLEDTLIFSREIDGVFPCLDFAHLHARPGNGTVNTFDEWKTIIESYERNLGSESLNELHIHLSGIEYTSKGEKNHLPIKDSDLNIKSLFIVLKDSKCCGRILCESPILEQDSIYMRELWDGL